MDTTCKVVALLRQIADPQATAGEVDKALTSLHQCSPQEMEDFLMQLVHVTIVHETAYAKLRKYLMKLASRSMHLGLRLSWMVDSLATSFPSSSVMHTRVHELKDALENATINRSGQVLSDEELSKEVRRKEERCSLYNSQRWWVNQLTSISNTLRLVQDRSSRKGELRATLREIEEKLESTSFYFPLSRSDAVPRWVVRISVDQCTVFSSRERAPFLLMVETVQNSSESTLENPDMPSWSSFDELQKSHDGGDKELPAPPPKHNRMLSSDVRGDEEVSLLKVIYGESSLEKKQRLRNESPFGRNPTWDSIAMIVKAGDDLKQEELALQLIGWFADTWINAGCTACVKSYDAVSTTPDGGLIEFINDASSIDAVKKAAQVESVHQYFVRAYGGEDTKPFAVAQRNFIESMAGYSVVCFLMQIKDRHNANLMLTRDGHLIHIDFGFMFATSPGGINFESAPFKLSQELLDVMGGVNSSTFNYFKVLVYQAFMAVRERADEFLSLIELMVPQTTLPCFGADPAGVMQQMRNRLRLNSNSCELALVVKDLVEVSVDNWRTRKYDQFQTLQNGIK